MISGVLFFFGAGMRAAPRVASPGRLWPPVAGFAMRDVPFFGSPGRCVAMGGRIFGPMLERETNRRGAGAAPRRRAPSRFVVEIREVGR
jgi:hypothetical protein